MADSSRRRQCEPVLRHHQSPYNSSSGFASSTSGFSARAPAAGLFPRAAVSSGSAASSVRFSLDRSVSSGVRSLSGGGTASSRAGIRPGARRTCMCSPTSHPGSFRCGFHKSLASSAGASSHAQPNRLNARRSAMTNSLVRIGGVEGDLVRRALAALIRPSSHHQRRRNGFQPRRSRLSAMSRAEDL